MIKLRCSVTGCKLFSSSNFIRLQVALCCITYCVSCLYIMYLHPCNQWKDLKKKKKRVPVDDSDN